MLFPNIIGGAGVSKRIVQPGETIYAWAGSREGELSVSAMTLALPGSGGAGANVAARAVAMGEAMVIGTIAAPQQPGVYELRCGGVGLGSVTVERAYASAQTIALLPTDNPAGVIAAAPAGSTIILPRGETVIGAEIAIPVALKFKSFGDSVLMNRVPNNGFMFSTNSDLAFEGVRFVGPAGPPLMQRNKDRAVDFVRCDFDGLGVMSNNSWLPHAHVIDCTFRGGSGVLLCSGAVVRCRFSGRPRVQHPVSICSDESLIALCEFKGCERGVVGMGSCSAYAIAENIFETGGQTNQKEVILFEDSDATNGVIAGNVFRGTGGPAVQFMGAMRTMEARGNLIRGNIISGCHTAFVLDNKFSGKQMRDNYFDANQIYDCAQVARLSSVDRTTVSNVFNETSVVRQLPFFDNTGRITPEGANPAPLLLTDLMWDPAAGRIVSASGQFVPAHTMCMLTITGAGWPGGWNQILQVISATEIVVRNPQGPLALARGAAKIDGLCLFEASDPGNVVRGGRVIRPYSKEYRAGGFEFQNVPLIT